MSTRTDRGQHDPRVSIAMGRRLRRQTQKDLADELARATGERWSRVMVGHLETGKKTLTVETLMAISEIQDLPYEFYLEGPDNKGRARLLAGIAA